ncbi:MAG: phosphate signaling complex protein PhoU [Candidatus Dormibacteraeota bacterium]|nr:phosphate signaling complex protein PhoU [Candidatus Dormibacteraeota bacterium]
MAEHTVIRGAFERELELLRESLLRMAGLVESQIDDALNALRDLDEDLARQVRRNDLTINELQRQIREQVFVVIATQQPVARDLRTLMGVQYIAMELERIGDYAVRIARRSRILSGLPHRPLRTEFGLMGELAREQVHDILDALIEQDGDAAQQIAARDDEIDRLYHRVFDALIEEMAQDTESEADALRCVTLIQIAHNLERIGDRITNVAEDIVFLQSGTVVEL